MRNAPVRAPAREVLVGGGRVYEMITALYGRTLALALIAVLAPLWLVIAALIKATSPGPVLFHMPIIGRAAGRSRTTSSAR